MPGIDSSPADTRDRARRCSLVTLLTRHLSSALSPRPWYLLFLVLYRGEPSLVGNARAACSISVSPVAKPDTNTQSHFRRALVRYPAFSFLVYSGHLFCHYLTAVLLDTVDLGSNSYLFFHDKNHFVLDGVMPLVSVLFHLVYRLSAYLSVRVAYTPRSPANGLFSLRETNLPSLGWENSILRPSKVYLPCTC